MSAASDAADFRLTASHAGEERLLEVRQNGADRYEFAYSDYRDWNNPLHPAEAFYAGRMTEKKNGDIVSDITTTMTETGQMYVVMPVPASIKTAMTPTHPGE